MISLKRPYLVIPKLVEQSTWGGSYIAAYKEWLHKANLETVKIGQSYELSGQAQLALDITDSTDANFGPEGHIQIKTAVIADLVKEDNVNVIGKAVWITAGRMPLLIKFTQALGNSFQLHRKVSMPDLVWKPKPESWYFLEDGYMTFGIKPGIDVAAYKTTCLDINTAMHALSGKIQSGAMTMEQAKKDARAMITTKNPWQFVNVYHVPKYTLVDLSIGGLHHSWEEDMASSTGNIVYEVQEDVTDDISTLRSFDQGKFKADGSVRDLTIEEYFHFLDTDPVHNDVEQAKHVPVGQRILTTKKYCMDLLQMEKETTDKTQQSFVHLFVREGAVDVISAEGKVRVTKGHSCFIPHAVGVYTMKPQNGPCTVIKTSIEIKE